MPPIANKRAGAANPTSPQTALDANMAKQIAAANKRPRTQMPLTVNKRSTDLDLPAAAAALAENAAAGTGGSSTTKRTRH